MTYQSKAHQCNAPQCKKRCNTCLPAHGTCHKPKIPPKHKTPTKHHKSCKPSKPCKDKPCACNIHVNNTVFVDAKYGSNSKGQINNPCRPYKYIGTAILALNDIDKTAVSQWTVYVNPGVYNEDITIYPFINITGAGQNETFVRSVSAVGTSRITNLTIANVGTINTPLLRTNLSNNTEDQNQVYLQNVNLKYADIVDTNGHAIVLVEGSGINNNVTLIDVNVNANVLSTNTHEQILFKVDALLNVINANIFAIFDYAQASDLFRITSKATISGGNFEMRISDGVEAPVNLFNLNEGFLSVIGNAATIIVLVFNHPYTNDVSYVRSVNSSLVSVSNSTAFLDGVSMDFLYLAQVDTNGDHVGRDEINLLGLTIPSIPAPRTKTTQPTQIIKYVALSGNGDVVANGGYYGNIVTTTPNSDDQPPRYVVQVFDYTLLVDSDVELFNPSSATVTVFGKIINIKNISTEDINVYDSPVSIDPPILLIPNAAVTLQTDGTKWYIISKYVPVV